MTVTAKIEVAHTGKPGIPCPECKWSLGPIDEIASKFFSDGFVVCTRCNEKRDLWQAACALSGTSVASLITPASLGASSTSFEFSLRPEEHKELNLTDFGVPPDATILRMSFTPRGVGDPCFPLIQHGNTAVPRHIGTRFFVYGMRMGNCEHENNVGAWVMWVSQREPTQRWLYVIEALDALASGRFRQVILPAHIAFELSLVPLIEEAMLKGGLSKERVTNFLEQRATASDALNVLLPWMCAIVGVPTLPDSIRGALNRLRDRRNELVHVGVHDEIKEREASELLCAAMLGLEYIRFVRPLLTEREKQTVTR